MLRLSSAQAQALRHSGEGAGFSLILIISSSSRSKVTRILICSLIFFCSSNYALTLVHRIRLKIFQ